MFKWLGGLVDSNEKVIKRLQPIVDEINSLEAEFQKLSETELRAKTEEFRSYLSQQSISINQRLAEAQK